MTFIIKNVEIEDTRDGCSYRDWVDPITQTITIHPYKDGPNRTTLKIVVLDNNEVETILKQYAIDKLKKESQ